MKRKMWFLVLDIQKKVKQIFEQENKQREIERRYKQNGK
jgi:hypothetical protein